MTLRVNLPCSALLLIMGLAAQQVCIAETISEAVSATLQSHPAVLAKINHSQSVDATVRQAEAGYYPQVDMDVGIGKEWSENGSTRPGSRTLTRGEAGISATQMLYDGFETKSAVEQAKFQSESSRYTVTDTAESIALRAVEVYLDVMRKQDLRLLTQDNLDSHERTLSLIQKRADSGVGNRVDLEQTSGRVALANANAISNQGNLEDSASQFQRVIGHLPEELIDPSADCFTPMPASVDDAIKIAISQHPALRAAIADHEANLALQQGAKAPFQPRVDLDLSARADNNLDGSKGHVNQAQAMVRMDYNLLNGGADQARLEQTGYLSEEAKVKALIAKREIENEVRLAWTALEKASARLPVLKERVELAKKTREAYQQQFNIGQRSLLDLLDTDNELLIASQEYTNVYYDRTYSYYWLMKTMGQLLSTLGIESPEQGLAVASPAS